MQLSIVIPAYNEALRIVPTLTQIKNYLCQNSEYWKNCEVIVVSDGSTDNTAETVKEFSRNFSNLKLITYQHNRGKGYAVKRGVQASCGALVLFADADGATPIDELDRLAPSLITGAADIAIASRRVSGANIMKKQSFLRIVIGRVFSYINTVLLGMPFIDTQCGFKLFKGDIARQLFNDKISDGFAFDVELLFYAVQNRYRVKEIGVTWYDGNESKVSPFKDGMKMLGTVLKLACRKQLTLPFHKSVAAIARHRSDLPHVH